MYVIAVTYEVTVTLPNEKFVDNMKKNDTKDFKDMQTKYCDAVSVNSLVVQFDCNVER